METTQRMEKLVLSILLNSIVRVNATPTITPMTFISEIEKTFLKFI
jgi:hypothetical protein